MKKLFPILIIMLLLTSCSPIGSAMMPRFDEHKAVASTINKLSKAINIHNEAELKGLFTKSIYIINRFDESINYLFEYIEGDIISSDMNPVIGVRHERSEGKSKIITTVSYSMKTDTQEYLVAFKEYVVNDFKPDEVGIFSFYIINTMNYTGGDYKYGGDGDWSPGIHYEKNYKYEL